MSQTTTSLIAPRKRRHPYLMAIPRACFQKDLWRDVRQNWRGIGLLYMLLLLAITWAISSIPTLRSFRDFLETDVPAVIRQVPPITITDGMVSVAAEEPYVLREPKTRIPFGIIDTTGETTELPNNTPAFLLTENELIFRKNERETRSYDLSEISSFHLDQARLNGWLAIVRRWHIPAFFTIMLTFSLIWRIFLMLAGGGIGVVLAKMMKVQLDYPAAVRLAAIAMTPGILLATFLSLTRFRPLGFFGVFLGIALFVVYLSLAIRANRATPPAIPAIEAV